MEEQNYRIQYTMHVVGFVTVSAPSAQEADSAFQEISTRDLLEYRTTEEVEIVSIRRN